MDLYLFTTDPALAKTAETAGVSSVIVDWERYGKSDRQAGHDTEINADTPADVCTLTDALTIPVTVRIDSLRGEAERDVETALDAGARVLMLPMAESVRDVDQFLRCVRGRARTLVQIETEGLVREVSALASLEWDAAYVGLNDLMISRGEPWLWGPLMDGTMDRIYDALDGRPVGFGGVTVLDGGHPLPFADLLGEMARHASGLSFLRRTFKREVAGRSMSAELAAVREAWHAARRRSPEQVESDRESFIRTLDQLRPSLAYGVPT